MSLGNDDWSLLSRRMYIGFPLYGNHGVIFPWLINLSRPEMFDRTFINGSLATVDWADVAQLNNTVLGSQFY
jgi:hypothetical protein